MGSEKCVQSFLNIYPDSEIFSLVDFLKSDERDIILQGKRATTSFIQKLPFARKSHRNYFPLFPLAIEGLDVSKYDVIVSSSHAFAKGVITNANQFHICYCHTPIRYAWDLYHQYIKESRLDKGIKGLVAKYSLHKIRIWDLATANRVDQFVANSLHVAKRIKKIYRRDSVVIYPPVDTELFTLENNKEDYYLTISRFVPYKKIDMIVEAFAKMPDKKLIVVGGGPDTNKIKNLATSNIEIISFQTQSELIKLMQKAKAFVFAAEEDFGITIVEAQSCGTPVIAYGIGGACETIIQNRTGIFFNQQTPQKLIEAVNSFEKAENSFDSSVISNHASKFNRKNFEINFKTFVESKYQEFLSNTDKQK
jgi:glycosyltransferase involved in cell wall biosynthesis